MLRTSHKPNGMLGSPGGLRRMHWLSALHLVAWLVLEQ